MTGPNMSRPTPRHVAIIMDGNGRWAERRGRPRYVGHRMGARAVRRTTEAAVALGLQQLTLYAFSTENWQRPQAEVDFLMRLLRRFLRGERRTLLKNGVRLRAIGRIGELPQFVQDELAGTIAVTRHGRAMTLCLAVNYGGQAEIVDACRHVARQVRDDGVNPDSIDAATVAAYLYDPDMPPLDLIVRTGGEMRLSNFLLWQAAYAELYVTPVCWPDFGEEHLRRAMAHFAGRERRYGAVSLVG